MPKTVNWQEQMQSVVGAKGFTSAADDMSPWLTDWRGRYTGAAAAMISPGSTQETAEILKIANENSVAIVPQGGNSGMVGGATPDDSGQSILLSLRRMNRIRAIESGDQLVLCEAGVILQNLHEALADEGQRFPLTLGGKGSATVGGLISTNAGGTQVLRHGTMRALVAGIEAVLPDGTILEGLAALKKDNRGYDLKQLLIGGEGTLGVVTAATLRTVPALIDRCVAWIAVDSTDAAYRLFQFLNRRTPQSLEGFEIIPETCLDSVLRHIPGTRPPLTGAHRWNILVELVRDQADAQDPRTVAEALLAEALELGLIEDATLAASEQQAEGFWKIRDSISEAERAGGPALQHDISVPVPKMARFINEASPVIEAKFPGTKVAAFGHMGDGNVHLHVKAPPGVQPLEWMRDYGNRITPLVHDLVIAAGGSISAELERLSSPGRLAMMRAIKTAIDPKNIMNPGKLVPLASGHSGS